MKHAIILLLALSSPALAAEKTFMTTGFTAINVAGMHRVVVTTSTAPLVRAVGEQSMIDRLKIEVNGQTLKISESKDSGWSWSGNVSEPVTIYVTTHSLEHARLTGSGDFEVDYMHGDRVSLSLSGSGDMNVAKLHAANLDISLTGSGDIKAAGECNEAQISLTGSGDVDAAALTCKVLDAKISGSGNVVADVSRAARLNTVGSGNMTITGSSTCEVKASGRGRIRCGEEN